MKCVFCKTDEKDIRYMLRKDSVGICDNCVILLSQKLNEQLEKDSKEMIKKLNTK
ncbi:ClpX C4-type zinc finger protein (plasmid) [Clostridium perfringens]